MAAGGQDGEDRKLDLKPSPALSAAFRRVTSELLNEPITDQTLAKRLTDSSEVLCIVDARRHAAEVFDLLPDDGSRFHLSAAMCPAHRRGPSCRDRVAPPLISKGTESSQTRRWREMDSNHRYRKFFGWPVDPPVVS